MTHNSSTRQHIPRSDIRDIFCRAMSLMYAAEVPLYGKLLSLVEHVNKRTIQDDQDLRERLEATDDLERIHLERHGAIRVGTIAELRSVRRVLQVMGMYPTGYYDLSSAGIPVHATCFRAHEASELSKNPFRMFVSLLRVEFITSSALRKDVVDILSCRRIFSTRLYELLEIYDQYGGLVKTEAEEFVCEAKKSFRWHSTAAVSQNKYLKLLQESPVLADIVAFKSPHINHLTPRTLDIDAVQSGMRDWDIPLKEYVEGPPKRTCPILLRQTSFKAIEESIGFPSKADDAVKIISGSHTARFGEIEQRGAALTIKGRQLYDSLLQSALDEAITAIDGDAFSRKFAEFPDSWEQMRTEGLAWFQYYINPEKLQSQIVESDDFDYLVREGYIMYEPIVYEDFLPVSAAGIFQSNLSQHKHPNGMAAKSNIENGRHGFEKALGASVADEMALYQRVQDDSVKKCREWIYKVRNREYLG
ncbi:hypothetical protein F5884DRAFT_740177 [Xylogone sp. PMI_703]|nr:hypothetical protein F5884DRAFT_740177 [Xylogone sp. PMI_703]